MTRPAGIWVLFSICVAVLLAAIGWVTKIVVRLDRENAQAQLQAEREERIRLALWRMDSWLAPLMVEESARPYHAYTPFHAPERAYTKMYSSVRQDILVPSPLLAFSSTNILLHFQFDAEGRLSSPQVPVGRERALAESSYATSAQIDSSAARLAQLQQLLNRQSDWQPALAGDARTSSSNSPALLNNRDLLFNVCAPNPTNQVPPVAISPFTLFDPANFAEPVQTQITVDQNFRNSIEQSARANVYKQAVIDKNFSVSPPGLNLSEGPIQPVWIGSAMVLARRVALNGRPLIQGCWLNWTHLEQVLLTTVRDLFPDAVLRPVREPREAHDQSQLAFLPVQFEIPPLQFSPSPDWTPLRLSLAVAWGCVLLAAVAVGLLLHGAVSLSERRGAFVSAVTHELRTPLTTFKIYSEMLAGGMVPDKHKQNVYLATLCAEANRLTHLVENVLAYARLERDRIRLETVAVDELISRIRPRLEQRTAQSDVPLVIGLPDSIASARLNVNVTSVEQILFNLVDNACKYAAIETNDRDAGNQIELSIESETDRVAFRVRDHGPGVHPRAAKKLFHPFRKSAREAAETAPGIGLGLALCRRLSRGMGGDLQLDRSISDGACFVLTLPR